MQNKTHNPVQNKKHKIRIQHNRHYVVYGFCDECIVTQYDKKVNTYFKLFPFISSVFAYSRINFQVSVKKEHDNKAEKKHFFNRLCLYAFLTAR